MILHDVAERAGLFVEGAASLDAELLGHGDLDLTDAIAVPQRLEEGVAESEGQEVLDGLLAQVVIKAIDALLVEEAVNLRVERLGGGQVVSEGLLDHQSRPALRNVQSGVAERLDGREESRGGKREVEDAVLVEVVLRLEGLDAGLERPVGGGRGVAQRLEVHVIREPLVDLGRVVSRGEQGRAERIAELLIVEGGPCDAQDQGPSLGRAVAVQVEERGQHLAVGQVSRGAEDHQRVSVGCLDRHGR